MKTHELKCWPGFFEDIATGRKTFEIRRDDGRGFEVADELFISEWAPWANAYTGKAVRAFVSCVVVLDNVPDLQLAPTGDRWVVLGLANVAPANRRVP